MSGKPFCTKMESFYEIVKYLGSLVADMLAQDDSALIDGTYEGHLEIAKYLLGQGPDIHAQNDEALTAAASSGALDFV